MLLTVPISPGELLDKITILQIKAERIADQSRLALVHRELELLSKVANQHVPASEELAKLQVELKKVNEALWDIEDEIRIHEKKKDFGARFIELARSVYFSNDRRAEVKGQINGLLGATIQEVKSYESYE